MITGPLDHFLSGQSDFPRLRVPRAFDTVQVGADRKRFVHVVPAIPVGLESEAGHRRHIQAADEFARAGEYLDCRLSHVGVVEVERGRASEGVGRG